MVLNSIGSVLSDGGDLQSALDYYRRALAIKEKVLGPEHPELTTTLANLAQALHRQNKTRNFQLETDYLNRALAIREKTSPASDDVADILGELGVIESERKLPEALVHLKRALEIRENALPADSPLIGITLSQLGEAYLNFGQPHEAKVRLERAWKLLEPSKRAPSDLGWTQFQLARALWDTHSSPERAIALAQESRAVFAKESKGKSQRLREVEAWLSRNPRLQAKLSLESSK